MSEPVGIGVNAHKYRCAGNPNRPGAVMYDCPKEARWVVVAPMVMTAEGKPVVALIAACDSHLLGIKAFMTDQARYAASSLGQEFTEDDEPLVDSVNNLGKLQEHFGDVWLAQPGTG